MSTKADASTFYSDVENLKKLCNFLLTGEGPRVREALLMEKRVLYLKGGSIYCRAIDNSPLFSFVGGRWSLAPDPSLILIMLRFFPFPICRRKTRQFPNRTQKRHKVAKRFASFWEQTGCNHCLQRTVQAPVHFEMRQSRKGWTLDGTKPRFRRIRIFRLDLRGEQNS